MGRNSTQGALQVVTMDILSHEEEYKDACILRTYTILQLHFN